MLHGQKNITLNNGQVSQRCHEKAPHFVASSRSWQTFPSLHWSHTGVQEGLPSFLEKGGSHMAPSLDCLAGGIRWW